MSIYLNLDIIEMLSAFASKKDTQYHLQGVYVDSANNSYVATDGNVLGAYEDDSAGACPMPLIIPFTKELAAAKRAARKQYRHMYIETMWLVLPDDAAPGKSSIAHVLPDKETPIDGAPILQITPIDGVFPAWKNVIPREIPSVAERGTISADMRFAESFALGETELIRDSGACVTFIATGCNEHGAADRPLLVFNARHEKFFGLLMPIRARAESDILASAPLALRRTLGLVPAPASDSAPASAAA